MYMYNNHKLESSLHFRYIHIFIVTILVGKLFLMLYIIFIINTYRIYQIVYINIYIYMYIYIYIYIYINIEYIEYIKLYII